MELDRKKRFGFVPNAFHGLVVKVAETNLPIFGKCFLINRIAMVLTGYITALILQIYAGLIVPTVTIQ